MNHKDRAEELFRAGCNCSQAVFGAFAEDCDIPFDTALKLSSSFGGGLGRMREVCGAVSGMAMVAGCLHGYSDLSDKSVKADHYALIQKLSNQFKQKNGSIICRELLSGINPDMSAQPTDRTPEFYKKRPCLEYVKDCADILDKEFFDNK